MKDTNTSSVQLRFAFMHRADVINTVAWSPGGDLLATGVHDRVIRVFNVSTGKLFKSMEGHGAHIRSLAWSPDGNIVASGSGDNNVQLWEVSTGNLIHTLRGHYEWVRSVAWSPDGRFLASGSGDGTIRLWEPTTGREVGEFEDQRAWVISLAWSPDGRILASGTSNNMISTWEIPTGRLLNTFYGHADSVNALMWSPEGDLLVSGSQDRNIRVWEGATGKLNRVLEGHKAPVLSLAWSPSRLVFASASGDGVVRLWRTDIWEALNALNPNIGGYVPFSLRFFPVSPTRSTLGKDKDCKIAKWDVDIYDLLNKAAPLDSVHYASAKIVLVGESNVGKSCLALRLAQDRYEEQGTTHGMRIWFISPEQLDAESAAPAGEKRDIVLWDMGGQDEYRLVHQLFFHDTTVALILLDPTRGRTAFEEVEGWNLQLEKQLQGRKAIKLLVGTKLDQASRVIDRAGLNRLVKSCGFAGYYETSAKNRRGIKSLRKAINKALNWGVLAKTSRPVLFQRIRDEIERRQKAGEVVLLFSELEEHIKREDPKEFDLGAVLTVVEQLSLQGIIITTKLVSGEKVLVLQIGKIEQYAGSIILAARDNPRGVPAIEEKVITSARMDFPGLKEEERLDSTRERFVLECVVQLLLEHGLCLAHEGLLIFPTLFQPVETSLKNIPHSISLYYDFSGAIDNIYSSLVTKLALSERFGRVRLWEGRAEFEKAGQGICGLSKVGHRSGLAHLDIFFSEDVSEDNRDLFTVFVEEHLRKEGVDITEVLEVKCGGCGYKFDELTLRQRLAGGYEDVICPVCEVRSHISEGAKKARSNNPDINKKILALKTIIDRKSEETITAIKQAFESAKQVSTAIAPIRILHLSDLHLRPDDDPILKVHQLASDLKNPEVGLGFDYLDYLVISGDLTNCATPEEFEVAYKVISGIINRFDLTAERCVIVPGNHDLSWDEEVYEWKSKRKVDEDRLRQGTYIERQDLFLIRLEERYHRRFTNFGKFYHALTQKEYPALPEDQCISVLFEDTNIQFLAMNSSWEIDEFHKTRSGINPTALSSCLDKADEQIEIAKKSGRLTGGEKVLRTAVWHHPITGNEKIVEEAFLERLQQAEVRLCLHGHVHENRADVIGYVHPSRRLHVIGAGSFGAPMYARPEAVPRLYNVIEIMRDRSRIRVHTRHLRTKEGAWEGWAVWPGKDASERRTFYEIDIAY